MDQENGLPVGWKIVTLGEIASVIGGGTPKTKELDNYDGGTIPWITPADLSDTLITKVSEFIFTHVATHGKFVLHPIMSNQQRKNFSSSSVIKN